MPFFPAHYLYGWLACFFNTHYVLDPAPSSPSIVHYSGFGEAKSFDYDWRCIHEGAIVDLGCTMLSKNKYKTLNDDGTLGYEKLSYLIALCSGYLPLRRVVTFYVMPYSSHLFSRNLGSGKSYQLHLSLTLALEPQHTMMPYTFGLAFYLRTPSP